MEVSAREDSGHLLVLLVNQRGHENLGRLQLRRARPQQLQARIHRRAADPAVSGVSTRGQDAELSCGHATGPQGRRLVFADAFQDPVLAPVQQCPRPPVWFAARGGQRAGQVLQLLDDVPLPQRGTAAEGCDEVLQLSP